MRLKNILSEYDYKAPSELIAQSPAKPRDSARLLVYNRASKKVFLDVFANISKYLPKNSVLVLNETRVLPARLQVTKQTGGKAVLLYVNHGKTLIKFISDRKLTLGSALSISKTLNFLVTRQEEQFYFLKPSFAISQTPKILARYGKTPLPPYIKNSPLEEKEIKKEYQSVFAKRGLSVAAPTASLHFTNKLLHSLRKQGIETYFVTLNVNLGTFATLKEENLKTNQLHEEWYSIDPKTAAALNAAKKNGKKIVAVGTTVVRTLESAAINGQLKNLTGETRLFIRPGFNFQVVNGPITNFHVPKSSLLMLVAALVGRKTILSLYKKAISKRFRLFSFGDTMLIL